MAKPPFTLVELAQAADIRPEEVEIYWDLGLLQPPRRRVGRGGHNAFHEEHLERLHFIKRATGYGLALEVIAQLVSHRMLTCGDVYAMASQRLEELRRLGAEHAIAALEPLVKACPRAGGREDCSIIKAINTTAERKLGGKGR